MDYRPAQRPLNILTIDGGGYQGISILLILGNLMKEIAEERGLDCQTLRPCDVFDVICGVGTGGWIALLLGRFMLNVSECHFEYCNIAKAIIRPDTARERFSRRVHHSVYDMKRLNAYVRHLMRKYKTGPYLLATSESDVRCKKTFVVASQEANKDIGPCLFRTYHDKSEDSGMNPNPSTTLISDAFSATSAKRGFLYPCRLESGGGTSVKFGDKAFPNCLTNATVIALDEAIRVYGEGVEFSTVINIGPGLPPVEDLDKIHSMVTKRFSWGSTSSKRSKSSKSSQSSNDSKDSKGSKSSKSSGGSIAASLRKILDLQRRQSGDEEKIKGETSTSEQSSPSDGTASCTSPPKRQYSPQPSPPIHNRHYFLCCTPKPNPTDLHRQLEAKRFADREEISNRINGIYVRLGPENAPKDIVINDVVGMAPEGAQKMALEYLEVEEVRERIAGLAKRIL
ncbi:hypothetical protein FGG08_005507 [Glutinoglossum americanum]|uniref:PNPLA domain-containing protein n=1 Tax=Glutinoglossum americanum TaxID=1670608 RepID=A0A9P8I5C4_9PEZI|nr:hypothetical protein FGG08_005507 [Glutinoglossum americanum]